jgi:hypothetical protein
LATSFASSLAWLILKFAELVPIAPWRLLFLIEGFPSVIVAAVAWHIIPDSPQTAPYLTSREKKVAYMRLREEKEKSGNGTSTARDTLAVLTDPAAWLTAAIFFLTNMAYSSLPVFMPTILRAMGYDALSAQALSAPPYLVSFLVVLATAYLSDVMRARSSLLIIRMSSQTQANRLPPLSFPFQLSPKPTPPFGNMTNQKLTTPLPLSQTHSPPPPATPSSPSPPRPSPSRPRSATSPSTPPPSASSTSSC